MSNTASTIFALWAPWIQALVGVAIVLGCVAIAIVPTALMFRRARERDRERSSWEAWRIPWRPDLRDVGAMALWEVRRQLRSRDGLSFSRQGMAWHGVARRGVVWQGKVRLLGVTIEDEGEA